MIVEDVRKNRPIFIAAELDDAELDPFEFRVYARLARRAGITGEAFESIEKMAQSLRMGEHKLRACLKSLEKRGMIEREERAGQTTIYRLLDEENWHPLQISNGSTPYGSVTPPLTDQSRVPLTDQSHEGNPNEVTPIKGEGARATDEPSAWWDSPDVDPLAVHIVTTIREATDKRGVRCYRNSTIKERDVLELIESARKWAPPDGDESIKLALRAWSDKVAGDDGATYARPVGSILQFCSMRRADWAKLAKALGVVEAPAPKLAAGEPELRGGTPPAYWIGDRKLTSKEARQWFIDNGRDIPSPLRTEADFAEVA